MTRQEALEFKARYSAVNDIEIEELRSTSVEAKLAQLAALMDLARVAGWEKALASEASEARRRWLCLKGVG